MFTSGSSLTMNMVFFSREEGDSFFNALYFVLSVPLRYARYRIFCDFPPVIYPFSSHCGLPV